MAYRIFFTRAAKKDIDRLDTVIKKRLQKKLRQMESSDDISSSSKRLVDFEMGEFRVRMGDYRITFDLENKDLYVLRVRHRKDVYRQ